MDHPFLIEKNRDSIDKRGYSRGQAEAVQSIHLSSYRQAYKRLIYAASASVSGTNLVHLEVVQALALWAGISNLYSSQNVFQ